MARDLRDPERTFAVIATVIASRAMIADMFLIVYLRINTGMMPRLRVDYTSRQVQSQVYISFVTGFLLFSVLFTMFLFRSSDRLASAYCDHLFLVVVSCKSQIRD